MHPKKICILGGTGFVGKHLAIRLDALGHKVKILSRHPQRHREILVVPGIQVIEANVFDGDDLRRELSGMDVVINLIGILNESGHDGRGFQAAHVNLPARIVTACKRVGVPRLLHMSAMNAGVLRSQSNHPHNGNRGSDYLRTKGEGEQRVLDANSDELAVTVFRPSLIFGRGDGIFGRFAGILKLTPVLPLACPNTRFAPVFVGDVVEAFVQAMDTPDSAGQAYDLCGPRQYSLRQLVEYTARLMGIKRAIIGLGPTLSRWQGNIAEYIPGKPFSKDNYRSLQSDSVAPATYKFPFGIEPTTVESIAPLYFGNNTTRARYMDFRSQAGR
jgi:NADH dehydrogenase